MCANQLSTQPYKGTRDFYPNDMQIRQWMFTRLRETLQLYGYQEYDGPMLEPFELYAAKTSEEIVNEQLYWLIDRGERKLAIRPEMTPTLARMVAAKQNELPRPIRWFSIPNLWRYERPQRGRLREHWQLNVDVFGGEPLAEDLEICQVVVAVMAGFGARAGYEVRLNHRGLTDHIFRKILGLSEAQIPVIGRLLDAAPKMGIQGFREALKAEGLDDRQGDFLVALMDREAASRIQDELSQSPHYQYLRTLLEGLKSLGIAERFRYDPSIMRGFLYYTGMVVEVYDLHPDNNRALFGGGRYDNLVGMFGGHPLPGVGFGMGDVTLRNFLEIHKLLPDFAAQKAVYVAHLFPGELLAAQTVASGIRAELANVGITTPVLTALAAEKPKKIFSTAERLGARAVVFVGPDDVKAGRYPIKDLKTGEQTQGNAAELASTIAKLLE